MSLLYMVKHRAQGIIEGPFRKSLGKSSIAQGTIEYLVVLAIVIVIGLFVASFGAELLNSSSQVLNTSNKIGSTIGSGGISITEAVLDGDGDGIINLKNNGDTLTLTKIIVGGVDNNYDDTLAGNSDLLIFLDDLNTGSCVCNPGETSKQCDFEIYYTSKYGLNKMIKFSVFVECVNDANGDNPIIPDEPIPQRSTVYLTDCNTLSYEAKYVLLNNITSVDQNCFTITTDNVSLDGNDFSITYANNGVANFSLKSSTTETDYSGDIGFGDFDNDGDIDFISATFYSSLNPHNNRVYLNDGSGNFTLGSSIGLNTGTNSFGIADLDSDGDLDIIFGTLGTDYIYLNDGSANFTLGSDSGVSDSTQSVSIGDLDNDGDLDFILGDYYANRVFLNDGSANFTNSATYSDSNSTRAGVLGDFDADGDLDYIAVEFQEENKLYLNDGSANFTLDDNFYSITNNSRAAGVADFDNDGDLDYVTGNYGANKVYFNLGDGNFSLGGSYDNDQTVGIGLADFDGDGYIDMYVPNYLQPNRVYLNDGDGTFTLDESTSESDRSNGNPGVFDMDGDGDIDVITSNGVGSGQANRIYENASDVSTDNNYSFGVVAVNVSDANIFDLNIVGFYNGVYLNSVTNFNLTNVNVSDVKNSGLAFLNSSSSLNRFSNCSFVGNINSLELRNTSNAIFNNNNFCSDLSAGNNSSPRMDLYCYLDSSLSGSGNLANMNNGCAGFSWSDCQ